MNILVVGCKGQVGTELVRQSVNSRMIVTGLGHGQLDIANAQHVAELVPRFNPDVVVNAAAYTAVDRAESDAQSAFAVNRDGPANLAHVCSDLGIPLVHYSTDYVFDGSKQGAYLEDDPVSPLGVYGESKLAGEEAVRSTCPAHLILRTSWVFSAHGHNFVKTMLRLACEREEVSVVSDQIGKPTAAAEIARLTLELIGRHENQWGTYHLAQPDAVSWYGFAEAIFREARSLGCALKLRALKAIVSADYPTPAKRPRNSELNCSRLERVFGIRIRPWHHSLRDVISELHGQA